MSAKTTKTTKTVETYTAADIERMKAAWMAEAKTAAVAELKAAKAEKRKARTTIGLNPITVDPDAPDGWNTLSRCTYVVEGLGAIDGTVVFARGGGFRAGAAVGAVFGVPGDTATGDTPEAAVDALEAAMLAKVAAFTESMRGYLTKTAAAAVKAGRVYRERPKTTKPEADKA